MSPYRACLLVLLNTSCLLRVAVKFHCDAAPQDVIEYWFATKNEAFFRAMLPEELQSMPLVEVVPIWDVIVKEPV